MDRTQIAHFARTKLVEHGLHGWRFEFDRAVKRAGACHHGAHKITGSEKLLPIFPDWKAKDTILHEIAHAIAGDDAGHGPKWRAACRQVGANPSRCFNSAELGVEMPKGAWRGKCPNGHESDHHREPRRVKSCVKCKRSFDVRYLVTFRHVDTGQTPRNAKYREEWNRLQLRKRGLVTV